MGAQGEKICELNRKVKFTFNILFILQGHDNLTA